MGTLSTPARRYSLWKASLAPFGSVRGAAEVNAAKEAMVMRRIRMALNYSIVVGESVENTIPSFAAFSSLKDILRHTLTRTLRKAYPLKRAW